MLDLSGTVTLQDNHGNVLSGADYEAALPVVDVALHTEFPPWEFGF